MRVARKNQQKLLYALLIGETPEYKLDKNGNKIVVFVDDDGEEHYQETGKQLLVYSTPEPFLSSISMSGSEAELTPFGISNSEYDATIVVPNGTIPITETSVIWYKSEVVYKDDEETVPDVKSADYTVAKVTPNLNFTRYELKAIVK